MKKIIFCCIAICLGTAACCQLDTTPPYLKSKYLPSFKLLNKDSVLFTEQVLSKNKPTILMIFDPECSHCKKQLKLLLSIPEVVQNCQLVLATVATLDKVTIFIDRYHLSEYPMVHVGKDFKFFFYHFLKPQTTPVLAFYNKFGNFVLINQGETSKEAILKGIGY